MTTHIIKHVTIKGCQVPVYAPTKVSIDVTRIITGVIFGSLLTAVGAIPFLI